jgi:hypothetical protein
MQFNGLILSSHLRPGSPNWSLPFRFSGQKCICISRLPCVLHFLPILLKLITLVFSEEYNLWCFSCYFLCTLVASSQTVKYQLVFCFLLGSGRFLFTWSLGVNQSEECYITGWEMRGGPTVFVGYSAEPCGTEPNSKVLPSTAQWGGSGQIRNGWTVKRDNTELLTIKRLLPLPTATGGFGGRLPPSRYCDGCMSQRRSSFIRKGMNYKIIWNTCLIYVSKYVPSCQF